MNTHPFRGLWIEELYAKNKLEKPRRQTLRNEPKKLRQIIDQNKALYEYLWEERNAEYQRSFHIDC